MAGPFTWQGIFNHLLYQENLSGFNGLGTWEIGDAPEFAGVPIPFTSSITRDYGSGVSDTNNRVEASADIATIGVASFSVQVYVLIGRWDVGVDFVLDVNLSLESLIRDAGAKFLRHTRGQSRSTAQNLKGIIDQMVQVFPKIEIQGRLGISVGISEEGRGYLRLSTLGTAGLSVNLPSPLEPIELGSFDNGGRHWQITLSNWAGHIPG